MNTAAGQGAGRVQAGSPLAGPLELSVLVAVMLAGFLVVHRLHVMPVREVRVMTRSLMVPSVVVVGCRPVMTGGVFVVLCCLAMMLGAH